MKDIEKRARELLADAYEVEGFSKHAAKTRGGLKFTAIYEEVVVRALIAALAPQWNAIETAPRDGSRFLAITVEGRYKVDYKHQETPASTFWNERPDDRYTHWQPLPSPPEPSND